MSKKAVYSPSCKWVLGALLLGSVGLTKAQANDRLATDTTPASWQDEAELTSVFFLNASQGWAVGAQGTLLRTVNGGRDWHKPGVDLNSPSSVASGSGFNTTGSGSSSPPGVPEMGLQQKIRAMQQGVRTSHTGIADGSAEQTDPYRCRFESVYFVDEKHGWVAGGYEVPYLNHSRGVVLRTSDGGVTWRRVQGALMPRIKRIHFSDRNHGWAVGDRGNLLPSSIFLTTDGGETWSNQSLQREQSGPANFRDADATDRGFVAITDRGHPLAIRNGQAELAVLESQELPHLNRLKMIDNLSGWAIGDRGALWKTQNGGRSWSPLVADSNSPLRRQWEPFDWLAITISPSKIWFAGNPGTRLFSIDRSSGEVLSYSTGISAPIRSLHFVDDLHGWMVGSWGTILATTDGGQTWHRQRGRQEGLAILGLAYDDQELPLEALAHFSSEEEWLMAVAICNGRASPAAMQAVERLGGVGLFSIGSSNSETLPPPTQEQQIAELTKLIRTLRPLTILCNSEYRKSTTGIFANAAFDPYLIVSTAIQAAANPAAYPEQLEIAQLQPWSVERVAYRVPAGDLTLDPRRMLLRQGCLFEDRMSLSRALLNLPLVGGDKKAYRLEAVNGSRAMPTDLISNLTSTGPARALPRRSADNRLRTNRAAIELANKKPDKLAELARFQALTEQDLMIWNQKIQNWLAPLDETSAGIWLAQLAEKYLEIGQVELAAKSLEYAVYRYHGDPLRAASLVWLAQYYSSDEFGQMELSNLSQSRLLVAQSLRQETGSARVGRPSSQAHASSRDGQTILVWTPVADKIELPARQTDFSETDPPRENADSSAQPASPSELATAPDAASNFNSKQAQEFLHHRWRRAANFLTQLSQEDPDLINQIQLRYLETNLKRKLTGAATAESGFKRLVMANEQTTGISAAAQAELALADSRQAETSQENISVLYIEDQPLLDGQLDDPIWQAVRQQEGELKRIPAGLQPDTVRTRGWSEQVPAIEPDRLMFAQDGQFLYVAIDCQKLPGQFYQLSNDPRPRDPDLSRRDRVELVFDVDRDYQMAFKFTVDYRGWGAEEINGARGWNPAWYIARGESESSWSVELAIPLEALVAFSGTQLAPESPPANPASPASLSELSGQNAASPQAVPQGTVWTVRMARVTSDVNLWSPTTTQLEKSVLSKGLYQQIQMEPAKFQFFTFR